MGKERFHLAGGHALVWEERTIDLHNNFEFDRFDYSVKDGVVSLSWRRCDGDWVADDDPALVRIIFTSVNFLKMEAGLCAESDDPSTLEYGGYLSTEDAEVLNGCLERDEVHGDYHFIFGFEGGMTLKIGALSGHVTTLEVEEE